MPVVSPPRSINAFIVEAQFALHKTQATLGEALGVSHRTVARWTARQSTPGPSELRRLAELLLPINRELAVEAAAHTNDTLESLGIVEAQPRPGTTPKDLIDIVLCAAANELNAVPSAIKPALHVAFKRAREVGLSIEAAEAALAPTPKRTGRQEDIKGK